MLLDTIAAISTSRGEGGISIIRISGSESLDILEKIFFPKKNIPIKELQNYGIHYGHIKCGEKIIDEVLVSIMKAPYTYTREDIVEINCHGGYLITEKILELVLSSGARLAEVGEFTRRAFFHGRIDLTQAEAVMDIIHGKTEASLHLSMNQLRGDLKDKIKDLKKSILDLAAHINVVLDYPEEGIDEPIPEKLLENLHKVSLEIENLIFSYQKGKMIKEGVKTVIVGKPNVGKSSLLNSILREERAIVTQIAGTTRDVIEEVINIKGIPLVLVDTAGIRDTTDFVENIGVMKSKEFLQKADLVLFVLDSSQPLTKEDEDIYHSLQENQKVIGILNKTDLEKKIEISSLSKIKHWIEISAMKYIGIEEMEEKIYQYIVQENVEESSQQLILNNIRHKSALEKTKQAIENIFLTVEQGLPMDLMAVDIKEALDSLSEITGEISTEDVLDHIFHNFCVGK